jgi:tetratricopeptide (TPR) repeat protein
LKSAQLLPLVQTETKTPDLTKAAALFEQAEQLHDQGSPAACRESIARAEEGLSELGIISKNDFGPTPFLAARLLLCRGNAQRDLRTPEGRGDSLHSYDHALAALASAPTPEDASPFDRQLAANILTNKGITLLQSHEEAMLREAVSCFEQSAEHRRKLPRDMHNVRWGLAAACMNRGDALTRLGKPEDLQEAVHSYDEAIQCLQELGGFDHPPYVVRYAVAYMNRGHALMAQDSPEGVTEAIKSFSSATAMMEMHTEKDSVEYHGTLGCAMMCHAAARMEQGREHAGEVAEEARKAIAHVERFEKDDLLSTEVSLKSRHLLCRALATMLDRTPPDAPEVDEWITEVTDTVDEGMALERLWEQRGLEGFRLMAVELFRFGVRVFFIRQPHFLAEFILECLDPEKSPGAPVTSEEMHHLASSVIWDAALNIEQRARGASMQEKTALVEIVGDLHAADKRLQELREQHLGTNAPVMV